MGGAQGRPCRVPAVPGFPLPHARRRRRLAARQYPRPSAVRRHRAVHRLSRHRTRHHGADQSRTGVGASQGAGGASRDAAARCGGQPVRGVRDLRSRGPLRDVQRRLSPDLRRGRRRPGARRAVRGHRSHKQCRRRRERRLARPRGGMGRRTPAQPSRSQGRHRVPPDRRLLVPGHRPADEEWRHRRAAHRHHRAEADPGSLARERGTARPSPGHRRNRQLGTGCRHRALYLVEGVVSHPRPVAGQLRSAHRNRRQLYPSGGLPRRVALDRRPEGGARAKYARCQDGPSGRRGTGAAGGRPAGRRCRRRRPPHRRNRCRTSPSAG